MRPITLCNHQRLQARSKSLLLVLLFGSLTMLAQASGPGKGNSGNRPPAGSKPAAPPKTNSSGTGAGNYGVLPGGTKTSPVQGRIPGGPYGTIPQRSGGNQIGTLPPPPSRPYMGQIPRLPAQVQNQIQNPPPLRPIVYTRLPTAASSSPTSGQAVQSFTVTNARSPQTRIMGAAVNGQSLGATKINPRVKAPAGNDAQGNAGGSAAQNAADDRTAQEMRDKIADMNARRNAQISKPLPQPNSAAALLR